MPAELTEALTALDLILDEETERLARPGYDALLSELVAAKLRAAGQLEVHWVRLFGRGAPDGLPDAEREALTARMAATLERLKVNAGLLERRIALCDDLLGAIAKEAKRATGGRSVTYGARGALTRADMATPISVNAKL